MSQFDPTHDRIAVISGAGSGIGRAIAIRFGELGWRVAVGGRRVDRVEETARLAEEAGGRAFAHALDVTDATSVETFFEAAEDTLGSVDVVINNAAVGRFGPIDDFSPEEISREIATKLTGSLLMARRGIQSMRPRAAGDIVFLSSESASLPWTLHTPYAAANAGVEHAVRCLGRDLEGSGIRVTGLRCGATGGTEFISGELESGRAMPVNAKWFAQGILRHCGLLMPEDVAAAVAGAVMLPAGVHQEMITLLPAAPAEEPPATHEEFMTRMVQRMTES